MTTTRLSGVRHFSITVGLLVLVMAMQAWVSERALHPYNSDRRAIITTLVAINAVFKRLVIGMIIIAVIIVVTIVVKLNYDSRRKNDTICAQPPDCMVASVRLRILHLGSFCQPHDHDHVCLGFRV